MPKYRWKVTLLSEGMLIWNCQQLFGRIPWLLWSLHPTECPNFDTENHGCGYLYILWENRFPHVTDFFFFSSLPTLLFFSPRICLKFSHAAESLLGVRVLIETHTKPSQPIINALVSWYFFSSPVVEDCSWLPYSREPGSQSESPNQCISYNSHTLLILPLKFMLLFIETSCCGPHCLPDRRVTVTQECWARCRAIPSDATPLPRATSIARTGQSATISMKSQWKPELPASPALLLEAFLSLFFFFLFHQQQQV